MIYEDHANEMKPLYLLQTALGKLLKYGIDTFDYYCDEVDLSYCDRNRVLGKARLAYRKDEYLERPCPKELLDQRWKFYTKTCGYSNEKARRMLAEIDKLYESQQDFRPNIKSLSHGVLKQA